MVLQGCSDVVESRVEHLFSMPNAAGMQLLLRIRNSPGALALGDAPTSDKDSPRRAGLLINEVGDLSNVRWRDSALRDDTVREMETADWVSLGDSELLERRISSLGLRLEGTALEPLIRQ